MPHNRTFRRLLLLPPTHPNVSRYIGSSDGGLGLPRLSNQSNLRNRKWSILCRLQKRGGLPAFAIGELLSLAAAVSDGQFLSPHQGAILAHPPSHQSGAAASARWARTQRSTSPPAWGRSPILFAAPSPPPPRLDNQVLFRALRRLDLSTWADLTTQNPDSTRSWLALPLLIPELSFPSFAPVPHPWPGDPAVTWSAQFL